jgi:outer membrane protein assembly factor BamB
LVGVDGSVLWEAGPTASFTVAMQAAVGPDVVAGATSCDGTVEVKGWDRATGSELWSVPLPGDFGYVSRLRLADGVVAVGTGEGVTAFDALEGDELWHRDAALLWTASGDVVLVSDGDPSSSTAGNLVAVEGTSGTERWRVQLEGSAYLSDATTDAERVYATIYADPAQQIGAYGLADGSEVWRAPLSAGSDRSLIEALDGMAVGWPTDIPGVATAGLDAASGGERWRVGGWGLLQGNGFLPMSGDGNVYVGSFDSTGAVGALAAATGDVRWSRPSAEVTGEGGLVLGAVPGGLIVVANGELSVLGAADGTVVGTVPAVGDVLAAGDGVLALAPVCPNLGS